MKKSFLAILLLLPLSIALSKTSLITKNAGQKRKPSAQSTFFAEASGDIKKVLAHRTFKAYADYTIENIRQGEIGEAQAYFVRLVKPISTTSDGLCFVFLGNQDLQGNPHPCDKSE